MLHGVRTVGEPWYEHDQLCLGVRQLLVQFYTLVNQESMFMSVASRESIPKIGVTLAVLNQRLATLAFTIPIRLWKMMPKLHLFTHMCEDQIPVFGNPRFWWTYADEDLVGRLITVAEGCHPRTLVVSIIFKWLITMFDEVYPIS